MKGRMGAAAVAVALMVAGCGGGDREPAPSRGPSGSPEVMRLVTDYARQYQVPPSLMHRVVRHESGYNPAARNGPYMGLMQIAPQTARTMGHRGPAESLLDAETNLRYGGKYLRGAWLVSRGNEERAIEWYRKGYYYEAKRMGLLEETGLR
ncbi:lytic transglycosylase domain-containing protein [Cereibacter sphaeroides]|uniref:lytic transglycosylase domain-containing protein n=1 Tax=Cereibacter sphaeroides TaxID=1063 RepID=UPI001F2178A8|nr:lytic transglycosylase domain-containing protein [Cereibacter sphaeroides]MCE6967394.1 lytic transglycosylase domain-containing protein [Cereibacter sphaeroides]